MSYDMTLGDMVERMQDYLDDANADKWTEAKCIRYLNRAKDKAVTDMETYGDGLFMATTSSTISSSSSTWAMPADFRRLVRLERTDLSEDCDIPVIPHRRKNEYQVVGADYLDRYGTPTAYLENDSLYFINVDSDMTAKATYSKSVIDLSDTSSSYDDIPQQHREYVVLTAVRDAAVSGNDANINDLTALRDEARIEMIEDLNRRTDTGAKYINYVPRSD